MNDSTLLDPIELLCTKCGTVQPIDQFYEAPERKTGFRAWCKTCCKISNDQYYDEHQEELQGYTRQWVIDNPERKREADASYRATHKEQLSEYFRLYHIAHRQIRLDVGWKGHLRRRYGLTPEDYADLFALQGGVCGICHRPPTNKRLHVDHDHACCPGKVVCGGTCIRGLLCFGCNTGIAKFDENPQSLFAAITYLQQSRPMTTKVWQLNKEEDLLHGSAE